MQYEPLKFDSKIFGFKVAKIIPTQLTTTDLKSILEDLKKQNAHLVFWSSDSTDKRSQQAAEKLGGFLVSEQITYVIDLKKTSNHNHLLSTKKTEPLPYRAKTPADSLKKLALHAGTYSRFHTDPKIKTRDFHKLYDRWIKNSVNKSIASRVIVTRQKNKITSMATLGIKNNRGDIGLLAVDENFRGRGLGSKLVYSAQNYFIEKGFSKMQVVTQKANKAACMLYEKCGLHKEKTENFYHFWLP